MGTRQIDLHEIRHPKCLRCNPQARKDHTANGICTKVVSSADQLSVRCVGDWAYEKIFHLYQYFGIFTNGMKRKWAGLNYVEICSGPGRCIFKETGDEVDGTALAILRHEAFANLQSAIFVDCSPDVVSVLNKRIAGLGREGKALAQTGDYTDTVGLLRILRALPQGHLNLVFIDPTDCSVPFATIAAIVKGLKYVDLVINLPSYMDAGRNLANAVTDPNYTKARQKYSSFLGTDCFFNDVNVQALASKGDDKGLRVAFRDCYRSQLAGLGHAHWATRDIAGLYDLVFASADPRGLDFWNKACAIGAHGQREFQF